MNKPAVVVLSGVRWGFLWQRHQILASRFAEAGYPTVFVETTGLANPRPNLSILCRISDRIKSSASKTRKQTGTPNLAVYPPLVLPPTHAPFRWLNRSVLLPRVARDVLGLAGPSPIVIAYPPTRTTLDLVSMLQPHLLLYDRSEDYGGFPGVPDDIAATEDELLGRADLVSCTSQVLLEETKPARPDAFLSGPGVDYEHFAALQEEPPAKEVRTVCYFGHLSRERTDFSAIRAVAETGFRVRLVGGIGQVDRSFLKMPGIEWREEVPHAELPGELADIDAFILPYRMGRLTRSISPAKIYEALATGKPVVASPLPSLAALGGHVYLAQGPEVFVEVLRKLGEMETDEKVRARVELARRNSWEVRFRELEERLWASL